MRVLVVSNLYPPVVRGGYEMGCASVAEHLRGRHEVLVLTSDLEGSQLPPEQHVRRELAFLTQDVRGALRAPRASLRAVASARRALAWRPDVVYVWNGAAIPQAALRVLADGGVPLVFRIEEHWFAGLFTHDQFLRELLAAKRGPARAAWARGARLLNSLPALRLDPAAPMRTAVSWNSEATRSSARPPGFVTVALERVTHPAPPFGDVYAAARREPGAGAQVVFLGRVSPWKGVDVAIQALALLRTEHGIDATLVVAGPEEDGHGGELRRLVQQLGLSAAVRWEGALAPARAAELLARSHALIVPSTWDEPFGYVSVEAAFARIPLVAADVGGIGEAMQHEQHALLFPRGDAAAAAATLARTLREHAETDARVQRAFERARTVFSLDAYLAAQERFLDDAVAALRGR